MLASTPRPTPAATLSGLLAGTRVMTAEGELPVELLGPGDRVITRRVMAQVVAVETRCVQNADVAVISPDTLGVGRPGEALRMAPDQHIILRDWRAKALWGVAAAAVPVSRLVDGEFIRLERLPVAYFVTLHLAREGALMTGGLDLCCPAGQTVPA